MAEKPQVTFRALQLANEQRSAYGLRYNDFGRYRKHCANRTHRLRSSLKITHGKGREFKKTPPITQDNIKDGHLQLLLLEAERGWAYAQDLLAQARQPSENQNVATLRHTATGRFRRAVNWATQMLSHCQALYAASRLSVENLLEAEVYMLILNGRFLRYRDDFEDALVQLSVARSLLDALADAAATSRDQALATLFGDEIGPEIRYCAHELGRAKAYDVDGIVAELASKNKNEIVDGCDALLAKLKSIGASSEAGSQKKLGTLIWEEEPVPIRNPELVDVLLKVQDADAKLRSQQNTKAGVQNEGDTSKTGKSKRGVAAYDAVLSALSDAEEVARKLAEAQQTGTTSQAAPVAAGTRDIHFVHAFIVYQLLSRRIERDLLLASALLNSQAPAPSKGKTSSSKSKKEQVDARLYPAVVKLLDTILQSLEQMRTLSIVDESPDLASAVEARVSFTKTRRCLYLSRCYIPAKKYAEALTLIQHASIHIREARSTLSTLDSDPISFYPLSSSALDDLEKSVDDDGLSHKKEWFAWNGGSIDGDGKSHKKPLFFDIALNYVQLDMERLQERAGKAPTVKQTAVVQPMPRPAAVQKAKAEEIERPETPEPSQQQARGGLSSLLGGWWGRR